ncbi:MAG: ferritin family protein [Desulfobacterales bacterium]|nr:ferritin family protein [Desulfobacterales bacterium]
MKPPRFADIIETAIRREEEAYAFYRDIAEKVDDPAARETCDWIAAEEQKHRQFLVDYRDGKYGAAPMRMADVVLYKIAEHQKEPEVEKEMKREEVFLVASHRELRSYRFYTELAEQHDDGDLKEMLIRIANEELKHKEKMEYLYANTAFPQTAGG